jgi:SAM-dependent methyltransferase/glycosyltransferase involved in cell wall biosynthesis
MGILRSWGRWICARVAGEALDVGCGETVASLLEREGHRVVTVDSERAGALPCEDASFDTVLLGDFLASWASRERPLAEARRVLRPGGRLIVTVPYGDAGHEDAEERPSLELLVEELSQVWVREIAVVDARLCMLAERSREKSRAAVWRRALRVVERRLAEREEKTLALAASVAELEQSREREEGALAAARGDVVRLEAALAAAAHRRDLEQEKARLAGEGVAQLEQRLEQLGQERERERGEMERALQYQSAEAERALERQAVEAERLRAGEVRRLEKDLAAAEARLGERRDELERSRVAAEGAQRELNAARAQIESRDRKLIAADRALTARDTEAERLRAGARELERKLALTEARLEKARQRADHFRGSLVELRGGRSYRLMRILWRLRRPFKRAPRDASSSEAPAADDADSAPPAPAAPTPPAAIAGRRPPTPPRQPGEPLRVASILDEMSEACFAPECDLVPLAFERWRDQLDDRRPDLLLVESAWNGNGGEWQYRIAQYPRKDLLGLPALRELLDGCRERGIPTSFWNKEDPVHFDRFAEAASLFDHVFTTDARCVERYRELPGKRTVTPLPFAAQPRIHNPAAAVPERSASPCFAGAWYRDRHPDRRRTLEALLDAARPRGLVIYDRSFDGKDGAFGFPERFAPHVLGGLPYERILDVYKSHRVFLNANSVVDSPTMCSRRVLELAACDTAILSTPGAALSALLGEGVVEEAGDEGTAARALERLLGDEAGRTRRARAARRAVFAEHTYADRLATIADTVGLDGSSLRREPFAAPGAPANGHPWQLRLLPGTTLSAAALADLTAAAAFAEADVIGAHPGGNGDAAIEHRHVRDLDPRALLVRRDLVEARGPLAGSTEQVSAQLRGWSDEGVRLYAADADLLTLAAG